MTSRRARSVLVTALLLTAGVFSAPVAAQRPPTAGITIYEDVNYGGARVTFVRDVGDLRPSKFERRISSFIIAPGEMWEMCDGRNFSGRCEAFSGFEPDLVRGNWNDRISSLRQVRTSARPIAKLELFAGTRYSGQRLLLNGPAPDFTKDGVKFNDRAMSVRVPPGQSWEICVNANYDDCRVIDRDVPDLSTLGVSRLISSARPRSGRDRSPLR
jgi:hypothetical protein